jgi:predicted acetylornithine/succinylornithine family transaminase
LWVDELPLREAAVIAPTYKRFPLQWERGEGCYLYDQHGQAYLDMASGIAVNALGYNHPALQRVLSQAQLLHTSNLYYTRPQVELAEQLCASSFASRVFFCNSGTEANEGALKFARKLGGAQRRHVVAFSEGFHGRTMGALAATSNAAYREPFEPLIGGVRFAAYNDLNSAAAAIDSQVAAVLVEPIQGEGGVRPAEAEFLAGLRKLCDESGAALIFDEVQCGLGRTGQLWAYQGFGVIPDILTAAKPLGGGLPIGAILINEKVAAALAAGDHGSTFGGGPLVCQMASVVLQEVSSPERLTEVNLRGEQLQAILERAVQRFPKVLRAQGRGLMWGLCLDPKLPVAEVVSAGFAQQVLMLSSGGNTLRLLPPLIVAKSHLEEFEHKLMEVLHEMA